MSLHASARLHALWHGLWRSSDAAEVEKLYARVSGLFAARHVDAPEGRSDVATIIAEAVANRISLPLAHNQMRVIHDLAHSLLDFENLFVLPVVDRSEQRTIAQWWEIRDVLTRQKDLVDQFENVCEALVSVVACIVGPLFEACPALLGNNGNVEGIAVSTSLLQNLGNIGELTEAMIAAIFSDQLETEMVLLRLRLRIERNIVAASGGNPADLRGFTRTPRLVCLKSGIPVIAGTGRPPRPGSGCEAVLALGR